MYLPKHFEELNVATMHELIRAHPLATLVTTSSAGIDANHIPFHLAELPEPFGTLRGHVARANPILADIATGAPALAIFHGPDAYITPAWYPTKKETGKVVPTWNYAVVHAHGFLKPVEDKDWLRTQLEALTTHNEAPFAEPWAVSDAPEDYVEKLLGAIVGIEMVITRLVGKWKVSQNQPPRNRASVAEGLRSTDSAGAQAIADLMDDAPQNRA
ncbi:MAG TPA: FMN-binding negative transcriptional regulator [Steroidobacter sp.]|uniref:FMN-binding negative transcriptional regulator n=1 Tax=Steroidobacter sp. TaxID=1978227 RepID=UPI002ED857B0